MDRDPDTLLPVFYLTDIRDELQRGAEIHIKCTKVTRSPALRRCWRIYAIVDHHTRVLVSTRSGHPKDHKSADVLLSTAEMVGIIRFNIPRQEGQVEVLTKKDFNLDAATITFA